MIWDIEEGNKKEINKIEKNNIIKQISIIEQIVDDYSREVGISKYKEKIKIHLDK